MNKLIILLLLLAGLLYFFFERHKKTLIVIGFKYKSEKITISSGNEVFMIVNDSCDDPAICHFYETRDLHQYFSEMKFHIQIDSSSVSKLDTVIVIPVEYKKPIISFQDPKETVPNRVVFRIDEADPRIIIP